MIELFFATSVNVYKIMIAMEEMDLPYTLTPIDISKGEQSNPSNIAGAMTGKLPVIRDDEPADGGAPLVIFESGAILEYLAEKSGAFLPADPRSRLEVRQWLYWQTSNLGPVTGQAWHFQAFAPLIAPDFDNSYSYNRYFKMMAALWHVMDERLKDRDYLAGDYSIADMACFPWIIYLDPLDGMAVYPNIQRWRDLVAERPAVRDTYQKAVEVKTGYPFNDKSMSLYPWEDIKTNMITT